MRSGSEKAENNEKEEEEERNGRIDIRGRWETDKRRRKTRKKKKRNETEELTKGKFEMGNE